MFSPELIRKPPNKEQKAARNNDFHPKLLVLKGFKYLVNIFSPLGKCESTQDREILGAMPVPCAEFNVRVED